VATGGELGSFTAPVVIGGLAEPLTLTATLGPSAPARTESG